MKTFVIKLATALIPVLFSALCLAQNGVNPSLEKYSPDVKAVEISQELAMQSFVAGDLFLDDSRYARKNDALDKNVFKNVETYPVPESGLELMEELNGMITYPQAAVDQGIEGVVKVLCMVAKDGSVSSVVVLKDIGGNCAAEVCKVVKNIKFKPAMQNGYARRCNLVIPVVFDLTD
jgi:TonB family protein